MASSQPAPPGGNDKPTPADTPAWLQEPNPSSPPSPPSDPSQPPQPPSRPKVPTITDAVQTIKPSDFLSVHQYPCARTGLLTGLGVGSAVGVIRFIMGLPVPRACNWAVGVGTLAATAQYEYCQFRRRQEREKMLRVVEVYGRKQAEQRAEQQRLKEKAEEEARRKAAEEEAKRKNRSWWKVW